MIENSVVWKKIFLIWIICLASIGVHEFVHVVQIGTIDDMVLDGFIFSPKHDVMLIGGYVMENQPVIGVQSHYSGNNYSRYQEIKNYIPHMENQAYAIQFVFVVLGLLVVWKRVN